MYLFSRSFRLAQGDLKHQMEWAFQITEKVNQISETPVLLWQTTMSPQVGVLAWSMSVDSLAVLEALDDKLSADSGYLELVKEGAQFATQEGLTDNLVQLVHADADMAPERIRYVTAVNAQTAPGHAVKAIELGIEIAQRVKSVTGCPCSFGTSLTGVYGGVQWATYFDSIEQLEQAQQQLNADTTFVEVIDSKASVAYLPNAQQSIVRRIV
ncbi:MAG TPA: hypothetical protein VKI19_03915 [Acidimicrobiales bacterium]|nr:hypothetical protein [Acidimicrobiales bacterium]